MPSLREKTRYGLLYLIATEHPVGHIAGVEKEHPFLTPCSFFLSQSPHSLPREDVGGVEKIADKETGKLKGWRGKSGDKDRQAS